MCQLTTQQSLSAGACKTLTGPSNPNEFSLCTRSFCAPLNPVDMFLHSAPPTFVSDSMLPLQHRNIVNEKRTCVWLTGTVPRALNNASYFQLLAPTRCCGGPHRGLGLSDIWTRISVNTLDFLCSAAKALRVEACSSSSREHLWTDVWVLQDSLKTSAHKLNPCWDQIHRTVWRHENSFPLRKCDILNLSIFSTFFEFLLKNKWSLNLFLFLL